jgi:hypothetical protein
VNQSKVKARLYRVAQLFQALDRGFAECFQAMLGSWSQDNLNQSLANARKHVEKLQPPQEDPATVHLGDLGHFCEALAKMPPSERRTPEFVITTGHGQVMLRYLQDAFEVPYWEFVLERLRVSRANARTLSGDVVIRVLESFKIDVLIARQHVLSELANLPDSQKENIQPILSGIDLRVSTLESLWDDGVSSLERDELIAAVLGQDRNSITSTDRTQEQNKPTQASDKRSNENVSADLILHNNPTDGVL